jgi:sulfide:quinone oxidoreductase
VAVDNLAGRGEVDVQRVVVLGAGFAGLELATRLSEAVPDEVHVVLIDQAPWFMFGFSKLDVLFGRKRPDDVQLHYDRIAKPGVEFRCERITAIDPERRRVVTDAGTYDADVLVVALGADLDPAATPGLEAAGYEFYTPSGAERLRDALPSFDSGAVVISVLGGFFKCPPAPYETALMLHDYLVRRGVRDRASITLFTPLSMPIPISTETSSAIVGALDERDIEFCPESLVSHLDPGAKVAHLRDGRSIGFDLFMAIPIHRAPPVVEESGLTEDGWIPVDPATFATRFPGVYAVGDVTSAPVPRAGVIAEGEAAVVADTIIAAIRSGEPPPPYQGRAVCYIEFGGDEVAKVDVNFLSGAQPTAVYHRPSVDLAGEKAAFGSSRRARWFGY